MLRMKLVREGGIRQDAGDRIARRLHKVLDETADEVVEVARQLAPKRTGHMASTIHKEQGDDQHIRVVVDAVNAQGQHYAQYPEFGTVYQAAQPFLRPAVNFGKERLRRRLGQIKAGLADDIGTNVRARR